MRAGFKTFGARRTARSIANAKGERYLQTYLNSPGGPPVNGKLINHLFAKGIDADGVTVIDKFNKGISRAIERGKAFTLGGINGIVTIGNVGNIQYFHTRIKLAVDDQVIVTLQNSTATAITIVAGVLTFGASLTVNNIFIDGVSKTAAQAGVLLNDNAEHNLHIDFDQIAASNLILGTDSSAFGNFAIFDVRVGDAVEPVADVLSVYTDPNSLFSTETHSWHLDEGLGADALNNIDQTKPGAITGGVTYTIQDIVSWQDEEGYTLSDGSTYYKEAALTNLIANGVFIPKVNGPNKCAAYVTGGVLGDLQFSGKAPKPGKLVQSNCVSLDGIDDEVNYGDCGSVTSVSMWIKSIVDNQYLLSLDNAATKAVYVSAGVLTFGASLTASNIKIGPDSKTAAEAGALLNDNLWHKLTFDLVSVTATDVRLGRSVANYGNISVAGFILDELTSPLAEENGLSNFDASGNNNHGKASGMLSSELWANKQDNYHFNINGFHKVSEEAASVLARYSSLTATEELATIVFIDNEIADNNYGKYDEFYPLYLSNAADSLIGFFNKTATNNGATKVAAGYSFDGINNYIDTNFNPFTDAVNFQINNALFGVFVNVKSVEEIATYSSIIIGSDRLSIVNVGSFGQIYGRVNEAGNSSTFTSIENDNLIVVTRIVSNKAEIYKNGINQSTGSVVSTAIPNGNIYIGCENLDNVASLFSDSIQSAFIVGAAIDFNQAKHNTNLRTMLTTLGII